MAAEFIGSTVLVTLRSPPNGQVRGVVADITGQYLTVHDGDLMNRISTVMSLADERVDV